MKRQWTVSLSVLASTLAVLLLMAASPMSAAPPAQNDEVYVVQPGDTLSAIALRFGVTAADIAAANSLSNPNLIFVGQRLVIPGDEPLAEPAIVAEQDEGQGIVQPPLSRCTSCSEAIPSSLLPPAST